VTRRDDPGLTEDAAIALQYEITKIVREEIGMNEHFASQIAEALMRGLRRTLGGQEIYIPSQDLRRRDQAIRDEFNGRNRDELCRRYGIGRTRLYEIVSRGKEIPLFPEETGLPKG
jgi:Mor family transcriptional regulator